MKENDFEFEDVDGDPCENCAEAGSCDGWEAQYCCLRCRYLGLDYYCEDCDPMDI